MKRILTLICLLVINFSFSQIKFEAEVSKNNLGVNENLRVDFKMNKDGDNFNPPSFDGFRVVGGPTSLLVTVGLMESEVLLKRILIF